MTLQEQLQALIAKDKTEDALIQLSEKLRGTDEGNTITLLQSRWASNKRSSMQGILTHEDYNRERNRINLALLSVISDLEDSPGRTETKEAIQQVIQHIQNVYNVSGDIVHGDKIQGDKIQGDKVTNIDNRDSTSRSIDTPNPDSPKKKILFVASNPIGKTETSSGKESQVITDAINNGYLRDGFELITNFASNIDDFLRLLKRVKPAIVHLSMHGNAHKGIVFEDASGNPNYVSGDVLASFFELINMREKSVECVVLSACNSLEHADAIKQYVDFSIGMQGLIPDEVAIQYTKGLYGGILEGDDYKTAHESALILLRIFAKQIEWNGDIAIVDMPKLLTLREQ
jgi:Effector-associated domain 11